LVQVANQIVDLEKNDNNIKGLIEPNIEAWQEFIDKFLKQENEK
jgi:hypothetical protein